MILDLFAGAGGWDEGARLAGYTGPLLGIDLDRDACATATAAGHPRIRADVATYPLAHLVGRVDGLIASPPCPTWSAAGDGAGKLDLPAVQRLVTEFDGGCGYPGDHQWHDQRSHLVAQPMRWARDLRPRWVALEQVPPVLPIWRHIAALLRGHGYRTWCGILSAEEYGVPQTRKRAILIARLDGPALPPPSTHQPYRAGREPLVDDDLFGAPLPPPVSMAEALGWDGVDRPARTVCGARRPRWAYPPANSYDVGWTLQPGMASHPNDRTQPRTLDAPATTVAFGHSAMVWVEQVERRGAGMTDRHGDRPARHLDDPSRTITAGARGGPALDWVMRSNYSTNGDPDNRDERRLDEPAATVTAKAKGAQWRLAPAGATSDMVDPRPVDQPAHTITGKATAAWVADRPATTVQGDPRIWPPGHKVNADDRRRHPDADERYGDRAGTHAVQVSVDEAAVLQSFPPGYPWQGNTTSRYLQVGNAIPPRLAAAILAPLVGAR